MNAHNLKQLRYDAQGLIVAIAVQHDTGEILMQAYMNEASLQKTIHTGRVCYWSRSRQEFWFKGETSGHTQKLVKILTDCDMDSLLIYVDQEGPACHTGERSCFYTSLYDMQDSDGTHND